jgi:hypothetical protein
MPTVTSRRRKAPPVVDLLEDTVDKPEPKLRKPSTKDVPVGKIITGTLETRIASTLAKSTSVGMLNTVGKDAAITGQEAYNLYHPALRMLSRRLPDVALKTNLSKPDADDLELIIVTAIEYVVRIIDNWAARMYMRAVGRLPGAQTMPQPTQPVQPQPTPQPIRVQQPIEPELEEFLLEDGETPDIAPMKNGNGSIADLIERGYIPRDMGDNIA